MPTRRIRSDSCAHAANGHAATAPPKEVTNSRRLTRPSRVLTSKHIRGRPAEAEAASQCADNGDRSYGSFPAGTTGLLLLYPQQRTRVGGSSSNGALCQSGCEQLQ
jgi:hypothetical protein